MEMTKRLLAWASVVLIVLAAGTGFAQEKTMVLNDAALGVHRRPLVVFPHAMHRNIIACNRCHHDFDAYGANQGDDEGSKCSDCHTRTPDGNPIGLERAFHRLCKDCHEKMRATGKDAPPVMCGQCHRRHPAARGVDRTRGI